MNPQELLEQDLDALGRTVAPGGSIVTPVMQRIARLPRHGRPQARRSIFLRPWAVACSAAMAACLLIALGWAHFHAQSSKPAVMAHANRPASRAIAASRQPTVRRSQWREITQTVVLDRDVPVRRLLCREFQSIDQLDADGNVQSRLIIPAKAVLLASDERY